MTNIAVMTPIASVGSTAPAVTDSSIALAAFSITPIWIDSPSTPMAANSTATLLP